MATLEEALNECEERLAAKVEGMLAKAKAAGIREGMERAANLCRPLYQDADRPSLAAGAAECMIVIRRASDALLVAPSEAKTPLCLDCGRAPPPIDLVLPRAQWLLIHPEDGGVLCANCMLTRAEKLPRAINVTGLVTFGDQLEGEGPTPYEAISKLAETKEPTKS